MPRVGYPRFCSASLAIPSRRLLSLCSGAQSRPDAVYQVLVLGIIMRSMVEQSDRSSSRMGAFCHFSAARSPPCWRPARSPHCRGRWRSGAAISRAAGRREGMPSFAWRAPSSALPNDPDFAPPLCQAWPWPLPRAHTAVMRHSEAGPGSLPRWAGTASWQKSRLSKRPRAPAVRANRQKSRRLSLGASAAMLAVRLSEDGLISTRH